MYESHAKSISKSSSPQVRKFLPASILLMILGWGGLVWVVFFNAPSGGTRWLFFFTGVLALTGTVLPFIAFLNRRFISNPPATPTTIVRQAVWVGIYLPTLAWLRIGRVVTPWISILIALSFILIEWFIRLRERSIWRPGGKS